MKKTLLLLMTALSFSYGLEIVNFKESFNTFWREAKGKDYEAQQALFAKYIESKDQLFYKENIWGSTYDEHWQESRKKTLTKLFVTYKKVGIKRIDAQYDKYEKGIREVMQEFKVKVPDYSQDITVMIAPGITWGGSYMRGSKKDYLGLGVDLSLTSPELLIKPLVIHETFHHYHQLMKVKKHSDFNTSDAYYTKDGKLFWQLWDEGMAVWGTSYITGNDSLEYLLMSSKKNLYNMSKKELARYARLFLGEIDNPAIDRDNPVNIKKWFGARVKDNPLGMDTPPMIGYALGYLVIKEIEKSGIPREEFMGWNYEEAKGYIKKILQEGVKEHSQSTQSNTAMSKGAEINHKNLTAMLQSGVEKAVEIYSKEMNNTAVMLLVEKEGKRYKATAGLADRETKRVIKADDLFEIGSASKVFTGIAIFQLIEQGKLSLDTKLNTFYKRGEIVKLANYKGKNYWDEVTVGMLLQHTSGFVDYLNVYGSDSKAIDTFGGKEKHYTFTQIIDLAVKFGDANFRPGEKFKYCNTGFIILGDIISRVSGIEWHDYIQKNIIDKAGMKETYFGTRIPKELRARMPKGYMEFKEIEMPPSLAGSAGEIISTLDDLATLMKAWGTGELYSKPETLKLQLNKGFHQQYDKVDNVYYGYAIMKIEGFYGHGGQTFGFQSYMTINPESGDVYVVGVNDSQIMSIDLFMQMAGIGYHFTSEH